MDSIDKRILKLLQEDASLPLAELSERVGLSQTPCWRRIQKLKEAGVIRKQVSLLDPARINLGVTVFVSVRTSEHTPQWLERFARGVADIAEVMEVYRMSGDVDYLLRVVVPDIAGYDKVYKKLIKAANLHDVSSSFAMECLKHTTVMPLDYVAASR